MKEKQTISQKIKSKKIKKPPYVIYKAHCNPEELLADAKKFDAFVATFKKYGVEVTYLDDVRKEKSSHIVISNHASRMDYIFTGVPTLPNAYNFVAGHNEFYRSHLKGVFGLFNNIVGDCSNFFAYESSIRGL